MKAKAKQPAAETETETDYAIIVEPLADEDGGGFLASVPALPGCFGDGATRAEALQDVLHAIEEWTDAARQLGRDIPGPAALGQWRQRVPRTLHEKLRRLAAAEGVSLNQLVATLLAEAVGKQAAKQAVAAGPIWQTDLKTARSAELEDVLIVRKPTAKSERTPKPVPVKMAAKP